jgi:hypothetical protein
MSKAKMQEARELIRMGHYREAREILQTIDHPTAREWLQKLNKIAPEEPKTDTHKSVSYGYTPPSLSDKDNLDWVWNLNSLQQPQEENTRKTPLPFAPEEEVKQKRTPLSIARFILDVIGFLLLVRAVIMMFQLDFRPMGYMVGGLFLGWTLRLFARAGRKPEERALLILILIAGVVMLLSIFSIEYGFYLRDIGIYQLTFSGTYISVFIRYTLATFDFNHFLLILGAVLSGMPLVIMTDRELYKPPKRKPKPVKIVPSKKIY